MSDVETTWVVTAGVAIELSDNSMAQHEGNVRAAITLLDRALQALNHAGYSHEHHESSYGEVWTALAAIIGRAYPDLSGVEVMYERACSNPGFLLEIIDEMRADKEEES